jgi:hypothetical protein
MLANSGSGPWSISQHVVRPGETSQLNRPARRWDLVQACGNCPPIAQISLILA